MQIHERSPRISIITAVRNAGTLLEKTIQSIVDQAYPNIEYIVIDGGSTDETLDIIKKYSNVIDILVSEPDTGIANAMNKGFKCFTGDIVTFLNAGDYYTDSDSIGKIAEWYQKSHWKWAYGFARLLICYEETDLKQKIEKHDRLSYLYKTPHCHQATFFSRDLVEQVGYYIEDNDHVMDAEYFIRCVQRTEAQMIPEYVVWYDITGFSSKKSLRILKSRLTLASKYSVGLSGWIRWSIPPVIVFLFIKSKARNMVKGFYLRATNRKGCCHV